MNTIKYFSDRDNFNQFEPAPSSHTKDRAPNQLDWVTDQLKFRDNKFTSQNHRVCFLPVLLALFKASAFLLLNLNHFFPFSKPIELLLYVYEAGDDFLKVSHIHQLLFISAVNLVLSPPQIVIYR